MYMDNRTCVWLNHLGWMFRGGRTSLTEPNVLSSSSFSAVLSFNKHPEIEVTGKSHDPPLSVLFEVHT